MIKFILVHKYGFTYYIDNYLNYREAYTEECDWSDYSDDDIRYILETEGITDEYEIVEEAE